MASLFDDPFAEDPRVPFALNAPPPAMPVPENESRWERGGKWAGLLSGIGATLSSAAAGFRGQPYTGQVGDMFAGMRARRGDERFQKYAKEMAAYAPEGSREGQLWSAVASGSPEMQRLLPPLWAAQGADARAAGKDGLRRSEIRSNQNIQSFRDRYIRHGVGIVDLIKDGLANKDSELRQAMEHQYGETEEQWWETERFREWALQMNRFGEGSQNVVPYSQFGRRDDGTWGIMGGEGEVPPEKTAKPEGESKGLLDTVKDKAKGILGMGEGEGRPATAEEELARHLGLSGAPSGNTPPAESPPPLQIPAFDPTMSLSDQYGELASRPRPVGAANSKSLRASRGGTVSEKQARIEEILKKREMERQDRMASRVLRELESGQSLSSAAIATTPGRIAYSGLLGEIPGMIADSPVGLPNLRLSGGRPSYRPSTFGTGGEEEKPWRPGYEHLGEFMGIGPQYPYYGLFRPDYQTPVPNLVWGKK